MSASSFFKTQRNTKSQKSFTWYGVQIKAGKFDGYTHTVILGLLMCTYKKYTSRVISFDDQGFVFSMDLC